MAKKSDELMALADVYAEAMLAVASQAEGEEVVFEEFVSLIAYMDQDAKFADFLTADSVDDDPRRASLEKIFRGKMCASLLNMLQVLNNRQRLELIRLVYRAVELRMEAKHHQQEVTVETAMPLTDALRTLMKEKLSAHMGREALLIEQVVPGLVGGVVIHIGDVQIDGSVSSRMRMLRDRFSERAVHEIHAGKGFE